MFLIATIIYACYNDVDIAGTLPINFNWPYTSEHLTGKH